MDMLDPELSYLLPGDFVFKHGDKGEHLYFVKTGT